MRRNIVLSDIFLHDYIFTVVILNMKCTREDKEILNKEISH